MQFFGKLLDKFLDPYLAYLGKKYKLEICGQNIFCKHAKYGLKGAWDVVDEKVGLERREIGMEGKRRLE
jgi:hypothetical protein